MDLNSQCWSPFSAQKHFFMGDGKLWNTIKILLSKDSNNWVFEKLKESSVVCLFNPSDEFLFFPQINYEICSIP